MTSTSTSPTWSESATSIGWGEGREGRSRAEVGVPTAGGALQTAEGSPSGVRKVSSTIREDASKVRKVSSTVREDASKIRKVSSTVREDASKARKVISDDINYRTGRETRAV